MRKTFSSGAPWEDLVGYSRAVLIGKTLEISGTVAVDDDGNWVGLDDPYKQAHFIMTKIDRVLEEANFAMSDVVRTRMYVTDIRQWESIGKAHGEFLADVKPATSMVEVSALISPNALLEIEVTAIKV